MSERERERVCVCVFERERERERKRESLVGRNSLSRDDDVEVSVGGVVAVLEPLEVEAPQRRPNPDFASSI